MKSTEVRLTKPEFELLLDYLSVISNSEEARMAVEEKYKHLDVRELESHLQNNYENLTKI